MTIDRIIDAPRPQRPDEPLRHVLEEHHHVVADDADGGEWVTLPVRAAVVDSLGPHVELGPYSLVPDDARPDEDCHADLWLALVNGGDR